MKGENKWVVLDPNRDFQGDTPCEEATKEFCDANHGGAATLIHISDIKTLLVLGALIQKYEKRGQSCHKM